MTAEDNTPQRAFHARWPWARNPHVRALLWLLEAPDLFDPLAMPWRGHIATLGPRAALAAEGWLRSLEADPSPLADALQIHPFTRLGRYAEKLLAAYFRHTGQLVAHGLQVRAATGETLGEFDFLLRGDQGQLRHWELATKFYLCFPGDPALGTDAQADDFVGPNLADTLGAKMHKIVGRQLQLGRHPAAQAVLPASIDEARALVKGWLFYRRDQSLADGALGISRHHCRGWWCTRQELVDHLSPAAVILPRLSWLAPARVGLSQVWSPAMLTGVLDDHFKTDATPVMIANLRVEGDDGLETDRGFVVPDDWQDRALQRVQQPPRER